MKTFDFRNFFLGHTNTAECCIVVSHLVILLNYSFTLPCVCIYVHVCVPRYFPHRGSCPLSCIQFSFFFFNLNAFRSLHLLIYFLHLIAPPEKRWIEVRKLQILALFSSWEAFIIASLNKILICVSFVFIFVCKILINVRKLPYLPNLLRIFLMNLHWLLDFWKISSFSSPSFILFLLLSSSSLFPSLISSFTSIEMILGCLFSIHPNMMCYIINIQSTSHIWNKTHWDVPVIYLHVAEFWWLMFFRTLSVFVSTSNTALHFCFYVIRFSDLEFEWY